ncbi:Putative zinc-finger domain-containing protein OS=Streptomyces albaduncus OX=68172 GN=FHS32_000049 PE=4 SV=1 [Streptomyces griseoloalbus]
MVEKLVDEVAERRARKRRRNFYMVAAAGALIVSGPFVAVAASGGDDGSGGGGNTSRTLAANPAKDAFDKSSERSATDPGTGVTATVALADKLWGTEIVTELKNVKGGEKCSLIAVGKNGERETVDSRPVTGEGWAARRHDRQGQAAAVRQGGAAFERNQIDHFVIATFDGKTLVEVDA